MMKIQQNLISKNLVNYIIKEPNEYENLNVNVFNYLLFSYSLFLIYYCKVQVACTCACVCISITFPNFTNKEITLGKSRSKIHEKLTNKFSPIRKTPIP